MTDAARRQIRTATLVWMAALVASRVAGLLREMVIARRAGATGGTDVYFTAFTLPDFINAHLAGGALSVTFIPIFTAYLVKGEDEEGWRVFSNVMSLLLVMLALFLAIAWIFAGPLCRLFASGFSAEQQVELVRYTRILLPAQLFFFAGGLFGAVQMARGRHGGYALAPLVYNAAIIGGGILLWDSLGMEGFCWGALAGAFLGHGVLQAISARGVGLRYAPHFGLGHPAVKQFVILTLPFLIGQSILVTDDLFVRYFGSHLAEASISWLNYAKKLALVIPAVLGQAAAAASFPTLSRQAEGEDYRGMSQVLGDALGRSLLLAGLGGVLCAVLNREATFLAFGSGRFSVMDSLTTGRALAILSLSIPAWVVQAILARGYYALRETWRPTLLGTVVTVASLPVYAILCRYFEKNGQGYLGLAIASAVAIASYGIVLHIGLGSRLRKRDPAVPPLLGAGFLARAAALILVSLVVAAILRGAVGMVWPEITIAQCLVRSSVVGLATLAVFLGAGSLLKLEREMVIPGILRRLCGDS